MRKPPQLLGKSQRAAAWVLGLGGLGSGGTAVFVTDSEAGPVALLVVGLILVLVAVGGRLPTRLKFGDNEAAWDAVEEYVTVTVTDAPPPERKAQLDRLTELAREAPEVTGPALRA